MNIATDFKGRLLTAVASVKPEKEVKELLSDFEDALLGHKLMPREGFDFVIFFIKTASALRLKCAANFFLMLHVEFYLFSAEQVTFLIESIRASNFVAGGSEEAAIACADMVAKNIDPAEAAALFRDAGEAGAEMFARFGLDVLRVRSLRAK